MTEAMFVQRHSASWKALEDHLTRKPKSFVEIRDRMNLYRLVSGHVSYAQTYYPGSTLCAYLERITAEAHAAVYAHTQRRSIRSYLTAQLPVRVRSQARCILLSVGIFLLSVAISFVVVLMQPDYAGAFLPEQFQDIQQQTQESWDSDRADRDWSPAIMSNYIMVNNIYVSVLAFGLGLTCGLGTAFVLVNNGFMLGALAAVFALQGQSVLFWSLILPHGVLELAAICIAGGAGLKIGYSLLRPGNHRRVDALLLAARQALNLMALVVILLCIAGVIEGFFTPSSLHPVIKLAFAGFTGVLLAVYLLLPQRKVPLEGDFVQG